ncbi:MAG: hypothetical protein H0T53_03675 [Herpetosiphonaceae bacterium]|nr:hypothetical protein [Herpetosiphonaceae bacterium]
MSQDKAEIQRELEHIDRLLTIAHNNRRTLEEQQIKSGSMLRLELSNQLSDIKTAIQELEERKNSLEIQAVEEDYSLAEAEYRVIAARAWEEGVLSSLGGAELQLSRLRLKIPKVRADQIEHEIRTELTRSLFSTVSLEILWQRLTTSNKQMFNRVYTMIKLNHCEFFDMTCRSLEVIKIAPDALFENYTIKDDITKELLRGLERNIIIAGNIVFDSDLEYLHTAIEYFATQLETKGLLADQ